MKKDYPVKGQTVSITVTVEKEIAEKLALMEAHSKIKMSDLANTALKRFISQHKDFLPPTD